MPLVIPANATMDFSEITAKIVFSIFRINNKYLLTCHKFNIDEFS